MHAEFSQVAGLGKESRDGIEYLQSHGYDSGASTLWPDQPNATRWFSIPSNIAEGCGRAGRAELRQYLHVSLGSASELDYFLLLARDLQFLAPRQYDALEAKIREIKLMLAGLIQKVASAPICSKTSQPLSL